MRIKIKWRSCDGTIKIQIWLGFYEILLALIRFESLWDLIRFIGILFLLLDLSLFAHVVHVVYFINSCIWTPEEIEWDVEKSFLIDLLDKQSFNSGFIGSGWENILVLGPNLYYFTFIPSGYLASLSQCTDALFFCITKSSWDLLLVVRHKKVSWTSTRFKPFIKAWEISYHQMTFFFSSIKVGILFLMIFVVMWNIIWVKES